MALAVQIGLQRIDVARQVIRLAVVVIAIEVRSARLMVLWRTLTLSGTWSLPLHRPTVASTATATAAIAAVARLALWALTVLVVPWRRSVVQRPIRTCLLRTILTAVGIGSSF